MVGNAKESRFLTPDDRGEVFAYHSEIECSSLKSIMVNQTSDLRSQALLAGVATKLSLE
jgi:O-phosphoseryl-tRNA(Cys) synthetase